MIGQTQDQTHAPREIPRQLLVSEIVYIYFMKIKLIHLGIGQARPQLHATLMQRMTDVLSQMLNDPMTRAALSAGGEDSLDQNEGQQNNTSAQGENAQNQNEGEPGPSNSESVAMDTAAPETSR